VWLVWRHFYGSLGLLALLFLRRRSGHEILPGTLVFFKALLARRTCVTKQATWLERGLLIVTRGQ
jgi:hypothetical protein